MCNLKFLGGIQKNYHFNDLQQTGDHFLFCDESTTSTEQNIWENKKENQANWTKQNNWYSQTTDFVFM